MALLVSFLFGFFPMIFFAWILYWLDRYEKEPLLLVGGVFLWGVVVAAGGAFIINTVLGLGVYMFTNSPFATDFATGSLIAPLVEETLKGLAVLAVFLIFRREFDSVLDGIIYAGVAALGFAATENFYYIYTYGYTESGWEGLWYLVFVRVILVGWQHPFYTAFFGIGLALARVNRSTLIRIFAPLIGLGLAMFTHGVHNTMATFLDGLGGLAIGAAVDWTGWFFMFIVIVVAIFHEQKNLRRHLLDEVKSGVMTQAQFNTATSAWRVSLARLGSIFNGKFMATQRFYQVCAELSHKKEQALKAGDTGGNRDLITRYQAELKKLAPGVHV